jgi:gamma-glutamyltranspeptidase/glutathione hydrolase
MFSTPRAFRGMVTAPHHLAAQAGLRVLREGGNAIEAMIAAAATIPVVYPHMNSIGGDGFWIVAEPGQEPIGIDACGAAGTAVTPDFYLGKGHAQIPSRGPLAANTVAGTVSGWGAAHRIAQRWGGTMPLTRLLEDAIEYAKNGFPVTVSQSRFTAEKQAECANAPGFAETFLADGTAPPPAHASGRSPSAKLYGASQRRAPTTSIAASSPAASPPISRARVRRSPPTILRGIRRSKWCRCRCLSRSAPSTT